MGIAGNIFGPAGGVYSEASTVLRAGASDPFLVIPDGDFVLEAGYDTAVQAILVSTDTGSNLTGTGNQVAAGSDNTDALLIFYESATSDSDSVIIRYQEDATADAAFDSDELSVYAIFENVGAGNFDTANII